MKRIIFSLVIALTAMLSIQAQQISVVSPSGGTTLCRSLQAAIEGADPGSIIYLPGGGFPISDEVKITKKLTIIGIGHTAKGDNVDGVTTISGNLFFNEHSGGSAVMGCYITGDVNIGENDNVVNDVLVKYCNLNSVQVKNSSCQNTFINQNYIRASSSFGNSNAIIKNNIINQIRYVTNGVISNNISCHPCGGSARFNQYNPSLDNIISTTIVGNVFRGGDLAVSSYFFIGNSCTTSNNLLMGSTFGDNSIVINAAANDIFENVNGWNISAVSNFHFKDEYKQYEGQVGIYAGTGFNDSQMAPVPYIVAKRIDEQTDASGKLNIKIRVKAGQ